MVMIFTGPIGSGKTTKLGEWVREQKSVGGILMPVIEGERNLYSIHSHKLVPVEIREEISSDKTIRIGKFNFSKRVFAWGNREILNAYDKYEIVIIDEIGPLELNGTGFASSLRTFMKNKKRLNEIDLILVIREGMIELVTESFGLKKYRILTNISDINL